MKNLKHPETKKLILNSFDRSGSSAIAKTLGKHPDIEIFFQPFNSSSLRKKMYQILSDENITSSERQFFDNFSKNYLDNSFIVSEWHKKHSTAQQFIPGKLHILKTTINHFSIQWIQANYPSIPFWGIWRNPVDILISVLDNEFHTQWYKNALSEILPTVKETPLLSEKFSDIPTSEKAIVAYLIAVRNYFFFYHLPTENLLIYENFKANPNEELKKITQAYQLPSFDFSIFTNKDLNVIGKKYQRTKKQLLNTQEQKEIEKIFTPLYELYDSKF